MNAEFGAEKLKEIDLLQNRLIFSKFEQNHSAAFELPKLSCKQTFLSMKFSWEFPFDFNDRERSS